LEAMEDGVQPSEPVYFDYSNWTFSSDYSDSENHIFSNDSVLDRFEISILKGKIISTTSLLLIKYSVGYKGYYEPFKTSELINGYALNLIKTDAEVTPRQQFYILI
jgi:hypothetical protein